MTDAPDRIWVGKCHPFRGDNYYVSSLGSDRSAVEYIRADLASPDATLLADMRDRAARVAFESEDVYGARGMDGMAKAARNIAASIAALPLPSDPLAAALALPEVRTLMDLLERAMPAVPEEYVDWHEEVEATLAAAQHDYEQRILSAIATPEGGPAMTDDALGRLIEAVEKGPGAPSLTFTRPLGLANGMHAMGADRGDLNAAKALHEALLPGWFPGMSKNIHSGHWYAWVQTSTQRHFSAVEADPARAWLLAVLRARQSTPGTGETP